MPNMRWTLLIGGSGTSRAKKIPNQPQQRLAKFKRSYNQSLTLCHKLNTTGPPNPTILDLVQTHIQRLTALLEDDTRAPAPHLCLSFAASSFVYTALTRISFALKYEPITREVVSFFTILVDSDEENLLATERFAEALMGFVDGILGIETEAQLGGLEVQNETLELIFGIAAKIRLEPELVPVWFRRKREQKPEDAGEKQKSEGVGEGEDDVEQDDFPLCHHFVWHVYRDGRAGDFARTGLLYVLESASNSKVLESWIALSDLPTLMASGLGGLYSQLSRKLSIARPKDDLPLILALSDSAEHAVSSEADSFFSEEFQARLNTFMLYLVFWQDVLEHCHSVEIRGILLNRFQEEFLQQILYPSLLQSSDLDGGSSVAVLTYLCRILDSVDHPDIIHLLLHYLLALPGSASSRPVTPRSPLTERRRKSLAVPLDINGGTDAPNPSFFNMTDLLLAGCSSRNPETVTAALRLVTIIFDKHHSYAISSLVRTAPIILDSNLQPVGAFKAELDIMISIGQQIAGSDGIDSAYENSLTDALTFIEAHPCSSQVLALDVPEKNRNEGKGAMLNGGSRTMHAHTLTADDPLLKQFVALLRTFLTNDIETNLGLTGAISHLASCPFVGLEGWLIRASSPMDGIDSVVINQPEDAFVTTDDDPDFKEERRIAAYKAAKRKIPTVSAQHCPIQAALIFLTSRISTLKADIPEFSSLLAGRKRAFQGATVIENELRDATALILSSPRASLDLSRNVSRSRLVPIPALPSSTPAAPEARSASPRGRTLSMLAGQRRQSPAMSPGSFDAPRRPTPLMSPTLRGGDALRRPSRSPVKAARAMSPLLPDEVTESDRSRSPIKSPMPVTYPVTEEIFDRRLGFRVDAGMPGDQAQSGAVQRPDDGEEGSHQSKATTEDDDNYREASLTHVLTNVVILQEFILELTAILHVRAGLLDGEVSFGIDKQVFNAEVISDQDSGCGNEDEASFENEAD